MKRASKPKTWEHSIGTVGKGSPVWAAGKLYVTEVNGRFHILQASKEGVRTLRESGLLKVRQGMTSLEEVLSVTNE